MIKAALDNLPEFTCSFAFTIPNGVFGRNTPPGARCTRTSKLAVVNAIERPEPAARLETDGCAREKLRKGAQLRLKEVHLEVDESEGSFETLVASGARYHKIVKAAERDDFDLIVVASLGHSGSEAPFACGAESFL
jgi:nucleotide-binding universal stress UspA family protein